MKVIGGSTSKSTARELSSLLKASLVETEMKRFPDGELYLRLLEDVSGEDVIVVQTAYPDGNIIELLLLLNAIREAGGERITAVIPYLGYARQDRRFNDGEPVSAKVIAEVISINADEVITVDPHKEYILDFFNIPSRSCSAVSLLAEYLKDRDIELVLAPDKGAMMRAKQAAEILNVEYDYLEKTRIDATTIQITPKEMKVSGKKIAIIDDIISTGGTMAKAIKELKKQGAESVYAACTHGLFVGEAARKIQSAGCDEIISTDTIPNPYIKVQIAPLLFKMLSSPTVGYS